MTKAEKFRKLLMSNELEFICEAHNGLSAKIVEEAGFQGIWASSLSISAAMGVRDNNELSWTEVLDVVEFICENTSIPTLLDGDTGYGNFNNVRRLVKKLEKLGVAAVCIEDKLFPKTNSFINSECQPLADIEEFSGKIKAAKDTQNDPNFSVIARVEAFIAGWGLSEALKRADAYHNAGADAILIHSKISQPDEVLAFKKEWADRCPVVIVPTKYYSTPTKVFREAGFSLVIWANMVVRSSITAMQDITKQLYKEEMLLNIEEKIVPVSEIFRLQGADELQRAEKQYLPKDVDDTCAVILAASRGLSLGALTEEKPKALLEISGKPLLYRQVDILNNIGVKNITVVRGYKKETINAPNLHYVDNDDYHSTKELVSLQQGINHIDDKILLVSFGDVLFKKYIPTSLLESEADFTIAVDSEWQESCNKGRYIDFVSCEQISDSSQFDKNVILKKVSKPISQKEISGEWIGLLKVSVSGLKVLKNVLSDLSTRDNFKEMRMAELFDELIGKGHEIQVQYIHHDHWLDVDDLKDFSSASTF